MQQAAFKVAMYGAQGSGKTFSALLFCEGLSKLSNKRVAVVDTEHGTDFYGMDVPQRRVHPSAFEFDALYSKSISEITRELKALSPKEYSCIVIDSMTHLWEVARDSYSGKRTKTGGIPINAWGKIKKPYKDLVLWLMNSPFHVFLLGREGIDYREDDETEERKVVGTKMKAEGETPYEPWLCLHMEAQKHGKNKEQTITAWPEKDRTGVLAGRLIVSPNYDNVIQPIVGLLGKHQAQLESEDAAASKDAEAYDEAERAKAVESKKLLERFAARLTLAEDEDDVDAIAKEITKEVKAKMTKADVNTLKAKYVEAIEFVRRATAVTERPAQEGA